MIVLVMGYMYTRNVIVISMADYELLSKVWGILDLWIHIHSYATAM